MERGLHDTNGNSILNPEALATLRIALATVVMVPIALVNFRLITRNNLLPLLGVGFFGNLIPALLFSTAQMHVESSYSGMLNSLTPFFTVVIGISVFKLKVKLPNIVGLIIGFGGAMMLFVAKGTGYGNEVFLGSVLIVAATIGYAISVNLIKQYLQGLNALHITAFTFSLIFIPSTIYLFFTDFYETVQTNPKVWQGIGYTAVLALIGTTLAIILFNYLIKISHVLFATSVTYLIPIVAIFWGVVNQESFNTIQMLAMPVLLVGVYLVNRPIN